MKKMAFLFILTILSGGFVFANEPSSEEQEQKEMSLESHGFCFVQYHPKIVFVSEEKRAKRINMTAKIIGEDEDQEIIIPTWKYRADSYYPNVGFDLQFDFKKITKLMPMHQGDVVGYFKNNGIEWSAIESFIVNFGGEDGEDEDLLLANGERVREFCFAKKWIKNGQEPRPLEFVNCNQAEMEKLTGEILGYLKGPAEKSDCMKKWLMGLLETKELPKGLKRKIVSCQNVSFRKVKDTEDYLVIKRDGYIPKTDASGVCVLAGGKLFFYCNEDIVNGFVMGNDVYSLSHGCVPDTDGCWSHVFSWSTGETWSAYP